MTWSSRVAIVCAGALLATASDVCGTQTPARFWISASGSFDPTSTVGPEAPAIQGIVGGTKTLYIWAQPGTSASGVTALQDISLDLVSAGASPLINFRRDLLKVYNPPGGTTPQRPRFQFVADSSQGFPTSSSDDDSHRGINSCLNGMCGLRGISGYAVAAPSYTGIGALPCDVTSNCQMTASGPAWLVASIGFDTIQVGTTSFNLQIGYSGMQYVDTGLSGTSPEEDVSVLFGTGNGPYKYNTKGCADCASVETTTNGAPADVTIVAAPPPPGDFDFNGVANGADFTVWRNTFGQTGIGSAADANHNGVVDAADYTVWRDHLSAVSGDYNQNGIVDAADFTVWRDTLGSTTDLRANGNNSGASAGKIDGADYLAWQANFGNHYGSGSGGTSSAGVPEPTAQVLLLAGMLILLSRRDVVTSHVP
jgi:hypothetical protein